MKVLLPLGLLASAMAFDKPAPIMDENSNTKSSRCTRRNMFECNDGARYNPQVSPNLKSRNSLWYDMEGYWVGEMSKVNAQGQPLGPSLFDEVYKKTFPEQLPYPQGNVKMFVNLTVVETRLYKHVYFVYESADEDFCAQPLPSGSANVIPPGACGVNGFIESGSVYAVATHEKDGIAKLFAGTGIYENSADGNVLSGSITPVDDNSLSTSIRATSFSESETQFFNNDDQTTLRGSGQHAADNTWESFTFTLSQTTMENFVFQLAQAQEDADVPEAGRVFPISKADNCHDFVLSTCPQEEDYVEANDPKVTESTYDSDGDMKPGFIALFVILGVLLLAGIAVFAHYRHMKNQSDRYKHQFARRIAQTIEFDSSGHEITPEALQAEFARIDEDKSGTVSKSELRQFMGDKLSDRDFDAMYAAIDLDHNDAVDFDEFCSFMAQIGAIPQKKEGGEEDPEEDEAEGGAAKKPTILDEEANAVEAGESSPYSKHREKVLIGVVVFLVLCTIGLLAATIALAVQDDDDDNVTPVQETAPVKSNVPQNQPYDIETLFETEGVNTCENKNPLWDNVDCVHVPGPQAGANVTEGFVGGLNVSYEPNTNHYWQSKMCPVNVHWHLGTEHYSVGEYDENGNGPNGNADAPEFRKLAAGGSGGEGDFQEFNVRGGFRCYHFNAEDPKFTTEYDWKHCKGMVVGETYEVHWPHSAAGACGTVNQYQTPFYDGVFCNLDAATVATLGPQDVANAVGVQGQIFTVVNDEAYFYPDMIRGWIVDPEMDMGVDIAFYTGSTTGTSRSNEICSAYTPITWQVDRKCHMISASSFDKLCYDMKNQLDDMTDDLHAHGSRELVNSSLVANNQQRQLLEHDDHDHYHSHIRGHSHGGHFHYHDHDHDHQEWF